MTPLLARLQTFRAHRRVRRRERREYHRLRAQETRARDGARLAPWARNHGGGDNSGGGFGAGP